MISDREFKKRMDRTQQLFKLAAALLTALSLFLADIQRIMVHVIEKFK